MNATAFNDLEAHYREVERVGPFGSVFAGRKEDLRARGIDRGTPSATAGGGH